jgi:hypothetical protein
MDLKGLPAKSRGQQEPAEKQKATTIPAERVLVLKQLFAKEGIELTEAQALEIGFWLLARIKPILRPIPLDKMESFVTIRDEVEAIKQKTPFINLYAWRRRKNKNNLDSQPDVFS